MRIENEREQSRVCRSKVYVEYEIKDIRRSLIRKAQACSGRLTFIMKKETSGGFLVEASHGRTYASTGSSGCCVVNRALRRRAGAKARRKLKGFFNHLSKR